MNPANSTDLDPYNDHSFEQNMDHHPIFQLNNNNSTFEQRKQQQRQQYQMMTTAGSHNNNNMNDSITDFMNHSLGGVGGPMGMTMMMNPSHGTMNHNGHGGIHPNHRKNNNTNVPPLSSSSFFGASPSSIRSVVSQQSSCNNNSNNNIPTNSNHGLDLQLQQQQLQRQQHIQLQQQQQQRCSESVPTDVLLSNNNTISVTPPHSSLSSSTTSNKNTATTSMNNDSPSYDKLLDVSNSSSRTSSALLLSAGSLPSTPNVVGVKMSLTSGDILEKPRRPMSGFKIFFELQRERLIASNDISCDTLESFDNQFTEDYVIQAAKNAFENKKTKSENGKGMDDSPCSREGNSTSGGGKRTKSKKTIIIPKSIQKEVSQLITTQWNQLDPTIQKLFEAQGTIDKIRFTKETKEYTKKMNELKEK